MKSTPWTDGKGNQEECYNDVQLGQAFKSALPDGNNKKAPENVQAICLRSQLFSRAKALFSGISNEQLISDNGVKHVIECIYQRDALTVDSEAFRTFNQLWNTKRGNDESIINF